MPVLRSTGNVAVTSRSSSSRVDSVHRYRRATERLSAACLQLCAPPDLPFFPVKAPLRNISSEAACGRQMRIVSAFQRDHSGKYRHDQQRYRIYIQKFSFGKLVCVSVLALPAVVLHKTRMPSAKAERSPPFRRVHCGVYAVRCSLHAVLRNHDSSTSGRIHSIYRQSYFTFCSTDTSAPLQFRRTHCTIPSVSSGASSRSS